MNYSQNDEQAFVLNFFADKTDGRILEIGAFDGRTFSNTLALVQRGWGGVFVEPSPAPLIGLMKEHAGRADIKIVQAAVTETDGWVTFHDSGGDAVSSTSEAHKQRWELGSNCKFNPFDLYAISLDTLFARYGFDFDFLNLDVESTNIQLFRKIPFAALTRLRFICVEHDNHTEEMVRIAGEHGFKFHHINGENLLLVR